MKKIFNEVRRLVEFEKDLKTFKKIQDPRGRLRNIYSESIESLSQTSYR